MDNSISMTRVLPAATATVEPAPRPPAASAPPVPASASVSTAAPPAENTSAPVPERMDLEALMERVGEQISEYSRQAGRELEFQVSSESNRVVILVKSSDTGEVVRTIPPEEVQRLSEALAAGEPALVDLRA